MAQREDRDLGEVLDWQDVALPRQLALIAGTEVVFLQTALPGGDVLDRPLNSPALHYCDMLDDTPLPGAVDETGEAGLLINGAMPSAKQITVAEVFPPTPFSPAFLQAQLVSPH